MKELLIGMGIGFVVGSIMVKTNKCYASAVENCVDKGKEIIDDIKDEVQPKQKEKNSQ